jgi:hypothetical protein
MSQQRDFPYLQSVYYALTTFIDHFSLFFPLSCIWAVLFIIFEYAIKPLVSTLGIVLPFGHFIAAALCMLLLVSLIILFQYQLLIASLSLYKREPLDPMELFSKEHPLLMKFLKARLIFLVKVFLGLLLAIVPGLYLASQYYFSGFSLLAHEENFIPQDAYRASVLSQGCQWQLLFVFLVHASCLILFFSRLGFLAADIFLLPITALIEVHLYYTLKASSQEPL